MEREDPLEKFERTHQKGQSGTNLKAIMYAMIVVALGLAAALVVVLINKKELVTQLNDEKAELTEQIQTLQSDYETLSSDYESINMQLDSSREEIAQLIDKVKKTEATNRAQIRRYQKELGTLRTIMRSYIVQIDSLNTLNHKLTVEAANARKDAAVQRSKNKELTAQVEDLSGKVATGSVIKGRGVRVEAFAENDKITDKSNKVKRLLVTMSLVENSLAPKGPVRVYVRVTDPDGKLLSDGRGASFTFGETTLNATASREIDYEGNDIDLGIYVNNVESYAKGIYSVQAYTSQSLLGSAELMLR